MNNLKKLIHEYRKKVPNNDPVAFVCGISSVADYLASYPEQEWGKRLDRIMEEVGDYQAEECRNPKPDPYEIITTLEETLDVEHVEDMERALACVWDAWTNGGSLALAVDLVRPLVTENNKTEPLR